jgi:hypothetical protein
MEFLCEDLRQFGVELIPPSAPEYDAPLPISGGVSTTLSKALRETSAFVVFDLHSSAFICG